METTGWLCIGPNPLRGQRTASSEVHHAISELGFVQERLEILKPHLVPGHIHFEFADLAPPRRLWKLPGLQWNSELPVNRCGFRHVHYLLVDSTGAVFTILPPALSIAYLGHSEQGDRTLAG